MVNQKSRHKSSKTFLFNIHSVEAKSASRVYNPAIKADFYCIVHAHIFWATSLHESEYFIEIS